MKHVWVPQPCWPTAESHPASPTVEAFHRSSSPSSCSPAAVPSAGPVPVLAVRQPAAQRTSLMSPPPHPAACAEWIRLSLTSGGHASRPASLGVASRGHDLLNPVRQTGQPPQQTTAPDAHQHSPAHAVPVVAQAASQGGLHASPVVKHDPDDQVATFARMQGHLNPGMPRYFHIPEGAPDFVPGGATGPPPSTQSWWDTAPGLSPHGCCDAQGRAGCCPTDKSPGQRRHGAGLEGSYASPMGHAHAAGPTRGGCSPAAEGLGSVGDGQGSCGVSSAVGESTQTLDVQAVCLSA
jgi:hypothetical protein